MPTYEYTCGNCGHDMEAFQRMSDDPLSDCPSCHTPSLKRKIGLGAGIIFKGGGFYETDFKDRKGSKPEAPAKSETSAKSDGKADATPVKSESKSTAKADAD